MVGTDDVGSSNPDEYVECSCVCAPPCLDLAEDTEEDDMRGGCQGRANKIIIRLAIAEGEVWI